ncbi:MAG: DUF3160 domain-containing protein [Elusimicrobia bacterium]|nr:DUF3160 domain-containing protein [Elusimicrobiota bacterium]
MCLNSAAYAALPPTVLPAPETPARLELGKGAKILALDVSRIKPRAAVLAENAGNISLLLWNIGDKKASALWNAPAGYRPYALASHPLDTHFFMLAETPGGTAILKLRDEKGAKAEELYVSTQTLRGLLVGTRPFQVDMFSHVPPEYRLFFGVMEASGSYSLDTITETGRRKYQVCGPVSRREEAMALEGDYHPADIRVPSALPVAFHPGGHIMLWQDEKDCLRKAEYDGDGWARPKTSVVAGLCGGNASVTPNGLGILHWQSGAPGAALYLDGGKTRTVLASSHTFTAPPLMTADGKGLVGATKAASGDALDYVPVKMPLADIANAWVFTPDAGESALFDGRGGLFRQTKNVQLYQLYESEFYSCRTYDSTRPARPYLVTTDLFWELFASVYEGLFILLEQEYAIPAFDSFVKQGAKEFPETERLGKIFRLLAEIRSGGEGAPGSELEKVLKAEKTEDSQLLGQQNFEYGNLAPNGHYAASPDKRRYFKAFRYLSMAELAPMEKERLKGMSKGARKAALDWIGTYRPFIASPRAPEILGGGDIPAYVGRSRKTEATLFPLAWGKDNEVLNSSVYHQIWPQDERVDGRMLPTGLDLAAVFGSSLAQALLDQSGEFRRYPRLKSVLEGLKKRLPSAKSGDSLYDKWISALALQWNDAALKNKSFFAGETWPVKRLQTGLASWATLRHATVLVNERTDAECGEGGFEDIVMEKPLGYVEPDPGTFNAIAGLLDAAAENVRKMPLSGYLDPKDTFQHTEIKKGLLDRIGEVRGKALLFAAMARKETAGVALTEEEYDEIHYVARTVEHNFLVFRSLANKDLALSDPDPMPKVADIAGDFQSGLRMAAVGLPLEWDAVTPYFGRRQITRGAVYSYYEFTSQKQMDDSAWLKITKRLPPPRWVMDSFSGKALPCPPRNPF